MEKTYSLHDRLRMSQTRSFEVGDVVSIAAFDGIIEYTDKKTGEKKRAVVVTDTIGQKWYLPNTIANAVCEMADSGNLAEAVVEFVGNTFRCEQFIAKRYGTKGKTLAYVGPNEPELTINRV